MAEQAPAQKKKEANSRKPSALKRALQSEQRRLRNRTQRASLLTAIRSFEGSLTKKEAAETVRKKLNLVYSLMDKGVKKGVFTVNKAARTKSRLFTRMNKAF
jgi:small subunit ribosomal protein S20